MYRSPSTTRSHSRRSGGGDYCPVRLPIDVRPWSAWSESGGQLGAIRRGDITDD